MTDNNSRIVLHTCCAVCGAYFSKFLKEKFREVLIYFYNPNIHPKEEYNKRKEAVQKLAKIYNFEFKEGVYDKDRWFELVRGLEGEPEGGKRCSVCFEMRLKKAADFAKNNGFQCFATTLFLSPHKDGKVIDEIGKEIAGDLGVNFLAFSELNKDKKELWQKTRELAKKFNFYHQTYCGCVFSFP